jgi:hypothetical protein
MSQDKFEWTDTSILEFVGFLCGRGMEITQLENELRLFKEEKSKQSKEDRGWEIVSFKLKYPPNGIFEKKPSGFFGQLGDGVLTEGQMINEGHQIYSVRRNSDSEVFSIGDEVRYNGEKCNYHSFKIDDFFIRGDDKMLTRGNHQMICEFIEDIEKITKPKPLFITEDGKGLFVGDTAYIAINYDHIHEQVLNETDSGMWKSATMFSTKLKAKEWLLFNKPLLSLKDILDNWFTYEEIKSQALSLSGVFYREEIWHRHPLFQRFKNLAKEKLSK